MLRCDEILLKKYKDDTWSIAYVKNNRYSLMEQKNDVEYDLRGWHLLFEQKRTIVTVTSNGTDDYLEWKFIPAEISYKSLRTMMDFDKVTDWDNEDDNLEIKWLY